MQFERYLEDDDGSTILLVLLAPQKMGSEEWSCSFEIRHGKREEHGSAGGIDALQALDNALYAAKRSLKQSWPGAIWCGLPIELAFPDKIPNFLGEDAYVKMAERLNALIEELVEDLAKRRRS